MPEPQVHPQHRQIQRVAQTALFCGVALMGMKFTVFTLTHSVAVLSDALESIINILAALMMVYSIWLSNKPADPDHPYGHGKIEYVAVGLEGWLVFIAGLLIAIEAIRRLVGDGEVRELDLGLYLISGVGVLAGILAGVVLYFGRKYRSDVLVADGKHLITDFVSTVGVFLALLVVRWTGKTWADPAAALLLACLILSTSWGLLWKAAQGLMDFSDPLDQGRITAILDKEVAAGTIEGYHKVRHRHQGPFLWVDMHLQVDPNLSVRQSHRLASRIENRIEQELGPGNATAHVEPSDEQEGIAPGAGAYYQPKDHPSADGGSGKGHQEGPDRANQGGVTGPGSQAA